VAEGTVARELRLLRQVGDAQAGGGDDFALVRVLDAGDDPQDGRLPGAVDADERDVLALLDLERHVGEDLVRDIGLGEVGNGQDGKRWHSEKSSVRSKTDMTTERLEDIRREDSYGGRHCVRCVTPVVLWSDVRDRPCSLITSATVYQ